MTAAPSSGSNFGPQQAGPPAAGSGDGSSSGASGNLLTSPLLWVLWGLAMAAMGVRLPEWTWPPDGGRIAGLTTCAVAAAVLARPYPGRPVVSSASWHHTLVVHRNTLLSAGFVVLVANEPPKVWEAGVDAALLAGYLLLVDAATMPAPALRRIANPPFLLGLAALIAVSTALIALPGSSSTARKLV